MTMIKIISRIRVIFALSCCLVLVTLYGLSNPVKAQDYDPANPANFITGFFVAFQSTGPGHCMFFELNTGTTASPTYFVGTMWSGDTTYPENYSTALVLALQSIPTGAVITVHLSPEPAHTDGSLPCAGGVIGSATSQYVGKFIAGAFQ